MTNDPTTLTGANGGNGGPDSGPSVGSCSKGLTHFTGRLRKEDFEVRPVCLSVGRALVRQYHYAKGGPNTRTYLHGLFHRGEFWDQMCLGVAWWIPPTRSAAQATYPANWKGVLALSRLVICPSVPKNACSFLLARSVQLIPAKEWPCLVTYADDWQGHRGLIYRAANWTYAGKTSAKETFTINGVLTAQKAGGHTRTRAEMLGLGAESQGKHAKHKFVLVRAPAKRKARDE